MTIFNITLGFWHFLLIFFAVLGIASINLVKWVLSLRTVVPTSQVHVVQRAGETISYGRAAQSETNKTGNVLPFRLLKNSASLFKAAFAISFALDSFVFPST